MGISATAAYPAGVIAADEQQHLLQGNIAQASLLQRHFYCRRCLPSQTHLSPPLDPE